MRTSSIASMLLLAASMLAASSAITDSAAKIAYPSDYRDWTHVKSALASPEHASFATLGGFHHIYANDAAMIGYRTGRFPEGSVIVFDWLQMTQSEGMFLESRRRQLDVMVKDAKRFAATGGWGFQRFAGDSRSQIATTPSSEQCFACHVRLKKNDLVLSDYRP